MGFTLSPNLKLRLDDNLTASAKANLLKLDALGAVYVLDAAGTVSIRNASAISLRPNDASVGGSGSGGVVNVGIEAQPLDEANVYATDLNLSVENFSLPNDVTFVGSWELPWDNVSKTGASVLDISDFDTEVSNNLSVAANTAHRGASSTVHGVSGNVVGTSDVQTLTGKTIDAASNTFSNISNASIAANAAISYSKLNLNASLQASDLSPSFTLDGSNVDFTSIALNDLGNHSHTLLDDVGVNTHAAIDSHIAASTAHGLTSAIVGVNDSQSLTNKLIDAANNTLTGISNSSIASNAAIAGTKINPDFGSQTVTTTAAFRIQGATYWSEIDTASTGQSSNLTFRLPNSLGSVNQVLSTDGSGNLSWASLAGTGTVTSVALSTPADFTVSGSPVTLSGTLGFSWNSQSANAILAGPTSGGAATPGFRTLVAADIPSLTASKISDFASAFSTQLAGKTTTDLAEGTNLYYTDERAQDAVGNILTDSSSVDFSYNDGLATITAVVLPAGVDHDLLSNFVSNEHVDHSAITLTAGTGLTGGGDITASRSFALANTAVSAGSYGSASSVATFTVDAQGRLTAAANASISITSSAVSDFSEAAQDAVGGILLDTDDIDLSYVDGTPSISASLLSTAISAKTEVSAAAGDYVLISDASDAGALKKTLLSSIASLSGGSYAETWTTGTSLAVTHNLASTDVMVQLFEVDSGETVYVDSVVRTNANTVTLTASQAPSGSGWRVLVKKI